MITTSGGLGAGIYFALIGDRALAQSYGAMSFFYVRAPFRRGLLSSLKGQE